MVTTINIQPMKKVMLFISIIFLLTNCNHSQNQSDDKNDLSEFVPEPDKAERLKYEAMEALLKSGCILTNPDTSIAEIKLREPQSTVRVIGNKANVDSLGHYHYYSASGSETLTLTQHPGDAKYQISIFNVEYSNKIKHNYPSLKTATFKTEKGIKLGITKKQLIDRLGKCYAAIDSTRDYIELYYIIQTPNDTSTKLSTAHNSLVYYASYKFWADRLKQFEFGFEYP